MCRTHDDNRLKLTPSSSLQPQEVGEKKSWKIEKECGNVTVKLCLIPVEQDKRRRRKCLCLF